MNYTHYFWELDNWEHWTTGTDLPFMKKEANKYAFGKYSEVRQKIEDSTGKIVYDVGPGSESTVKTDQKKALIKAVKERKAQLKADNAAFKALPLYKQRIEIAKDVLKWIDTKKLVPTTGSYFHIRSPKSPRFTNPSGSLQETLLDLNKEEKCDVCAKGAIFACTVARKNDVRNDFNIAWDEGNSSRSLSKTLGGIFSSAQLRLIEVEFEGTDVEWMNGDRDKLRQIKPKMDMEHLNSNDRMIRIMKNIITYNGWFKPELD